MTIRTTILLLSVYCCLPDTSAGQALFSGNAGDPLSSDAEPIPALSTSLDAVNFLVKCPCRPDLESSVSLSACEGGSVFFNGVEIAEGASQIFHFITEMGCDSVVIVSVGQLPASASALTLQACPGATVEYEGLQIPTGSVTDVLFQNYLGCDSTVTVTVTELPQSASTLKLEACPGATAEYEGQQLPTGSVTDFSFQNYLGCDSTVTVIVSEIPLDSLFVEMKSCPDQPVFYNGQLLLPGSVTEFVFENQSGCDSLVRVSVAMLSADTTHLYLQVCPGEAAAFDGQLLPEGSETHVVLMNQQGCDSVLVVRVSAFPPTGYELLTGKICWNAADGIIEAVLLEEPCPGCLYSLDGLNFQAEPTFENLPGGAHEVWLQDADGCTYSQEVTIPVTERLEILSENYLLPCGEESIVLRPQVWSGEPLAWRWQDGSGKQWFRADEAGIFKVEISDACETSAHEVTVEWGDDVPADFFYLPNAFSPNDDGVNDVFRGYPAQTVDFQSFELMVFDRWGGLMFSTSDPAAAWDGACRGILRNTGVYAWWVRATASVCGRTVELFREGDVTLMR